MERTGRGSRDFSLSKKVMFLLILLLLAFLAPSSSAADFKMVSVKPPSKNVAVANGDTFTLACKVSNYIRYSTSKRRAKSNIRQYNFSSRSCVWRHKDKGCKLIYSRTAGNLVKNRCLVYESQIFVVGSYEKHECAIQVMRGSESLIIIAF